MDVLNMLLCPSIRCAYPTISEFPTPLPDMLHCHYTGTIYFHKLAVDFHWLDAFCPEKKNEFQIAHVPLSIRSILSPLFSRRCASVLCLR
jgi:hypothetical protein